jgi:hypothetical protein
MLAVVAGTVTEMGVDTTKASGGRGTFRPRILSLFEKPLAD